MARRAAAPHAGPPYAPHHIHPRRAVLEDEEAKENETPFRKFMREQIWNPEKKAGNLSILASIGLFVGGVIAVRTWGDLMIPA